MSDKHLYVYAGLAILTTVLIVMVFAKPENSAQQDVDIVSTPDSGVHAHGTVLEPIVPIETNVDVHALNEPLPENTEQNNLVDTSESTDEQTSVAGSMQVEHSETSESEASEVGFDPAEVEDPNPAFENLEQRLDQMSERRNGQEFNPVAVRRAVMQQDMWDVRDKVPDSTPMSAEELSDGRPFVDVNPMKVESLMPGDTLTIYIPQESRPYDLVVEEVVTHDQSQSVTWNGHIRDFAEDNYFTATRGGSLIVGAITTPTTHYAFEVYDDVGWIEEAGKLFVEEGEPVIPEDEGHSHVTHEH